MEPIQLAKDTIDQTDYMRFIHWFSAMPRLTKGEKTLEYEKQYAAVCGRKHAVFVNSGSSANLIAVYSLIVSGKLKNKKIVAPALSWITTVSPIIQFEHELILCDINRNNLGVELEHLETIFKNQQPACLFLVSILGIAPDMDEIIALCEKYDVILIMDNCESQGSQYKGKNIESFGLMSTCSSYFGHATGTVEGGMVTTDDTELYNLLKMLRSHGWDRDVDDDEKQRLRSQWDVSEFNALYTFYHPGFNVRNNDMGAAFGLWQLEKLPFIIERRSHNFKLYMELLENPIWKPKAADRLVCNLGYPIIHDCRDEIVKEMQENKVEVRPLVSGSMGTHPFYVQRYGKLQLANAGLIDKYGFYLPNHPYLTDSDIKFMCDIINDF